MKWYLNCKQNYIIFSFYLRSEFWVIGVGSGNLTKKSEAFYNSRKLNIGDKMKTRDMQRNV